MALQFSLPKLDLFQMPNLEHFRLQALINYPTHFILHQVICTNHLAAIILHLIIHFSYDPLLCPLPVALIPPLTVLFLHLAALNIRLIFNNLVIQTHPADLQLLNTNLILEGFRPFLLVK